MRLEELIGPSYKHDFKIYGFNSIILQDISQPVSERREKKSKYL